MNNHMEAAVEAGMAAAYGGNCCPDGFDCKCEATQYEKREVTKIITATLPHIRAMIAKEIWEGFSPETGGEELLLDEIATQIAEGNHNDHQV